MSRLLFLCLVFSPIVASAGDMKHRFIHIHELTEENNYATNIPNIAGMGFFYFFDPQWNPEDLRIRVRIYRPVKDNFEIFLEDDAEIGAPLLNDPATLQYLVNLKPKKAPTAGKCLYRVDCFDIRDEKEKLLASNAVFITFVDAAKPAGKDEPVSVRPRPARAQRTARATRPSTRTNSRFVNSGLRRRVDGQ
jgi:hypothetical protein